MNNKDLRTSSTSNSGSRWEQAADELEAFADDLESGEDVTAKYFVRTITLDLGTQSYDAAAIRRIRQSLNASQSTFAQFLGVAVSTVANWEQGTNSPSRTAQRMLDEIRVNPHYFRLRIAASTKTPTAG